MVEVQYETLRGENINSGTKKAEVAWKTNEEEKGEENEQEVDDDEDDNKEEGYKEVKKTCKNSPE